MPTPTCIVRTPSGRKCGGQMEEVKGLGPRRPQDSAGLPVADAAEMSDLEQMLASDAEMGRHLSR